jgi:hypothetical protein
MVRVEQERRSAMTLEPKIVMTGHGPEIAGTRTVFSRIVCMPNGSPSAPWIFLMRTDEVRSTGRLYVP